MATIAGKDRRVDTPAPKAQAGNTFFALLPIHLPNSPKVRHSAKFAFRSWTKCEFMRNPIFLFFFEKKPNQIPHLRPRLQGASELCGMTALKT
jgi:hypothetical protein